MALGKNGLGSLLSNNLYPMLKYFFPDCGLFQDDTDTIYSDGSQNHISSDLKPFGGLHFNILYSCVYFTWQKQDAVLKKLSQNEKKEKKVAAALKFDLSFC